MQAKPAAIRIFPRSKNSPEFSRLLAEMCDHVFPAKPFAPVTRKSGQDAR